MLKSLPTSLLLLVPAWVSAQISGQVFRDANANGLHETRLAAERGLPGLRVRAYNAAGQEVARAQTDAAGQYRLAVPAGQAVRVLFEGESEGVQSSRATPPVQFVRSPQAEVNWGLYTPAQFAAPQSYAVAPLYVTGSHQGVDSLAALVAVTTEGSAAPVSLATPAQVGALWAVAFDRTRQQLYSGAFAKRHVAYGPLGTGGIYRTDWATRQTTPYLSLRELGIETGPDQHEGLTADLRSKSPDAKLLPEVGKTSLGGMDVSEDGQRLYVMNLHNRTLYAIALPADPSAKPTRADVTAYAAPDPGCRGGVARPFAVKAYRGSVYVGVVCDAQTSQSTRDLTATVFVFEPAKGNSAGGTFREVLSLPLDYPRGTAAVGTDARSWFAWTDDFSKALHPENPSTATRPQPILADIEFDADGAMILGFMDRFGHQSGTGQPDPTGRASYSGVAAGDILRVMPRKRTLGADQFRLEANAVSGITRTEGAGNRQGPEGGEFYFEDGFVPRGERIVHEEVGAGGLALLPGSDEILNTAHEPTNEFNTGGLKAFRNGDGKTSRGWALYPNAQVGTFGKANGVGDVEIVGDRPGLSLGDRLWLDADENGIQDPGEKPLTDLRLELWEGNRRVASTQSDAEGQYSFNETNVPGGLKAHTDYEIRVSLTPDVSQALRLTQAKAGTDARIDNDANPVNGFAVIRTKTGDFGENAHHFDLGFACNSKPAVTTKWNLNSRSGESLLLLSGFRTDDRYEWMEGERFAGSGEYEQALQIPESGIVFTSNGASAGKSFTLRVVDATGCISNLSVKAPEPGQTVADSERETFVLYPNPVAERLNVRVKANAAQAQLRLMDTGGKSLQTFDVPAERGAYKTTLNLSKLPAGNYVLSVLEGNVVRTGVILKE